MGKPKKGQPHHVVVPLVDATDFATIESGIAASSVSAKFYGVNQGQSAAGTTSGTVSRTISLVRSGIFRIPLKGSENNYDNMLLRVTATGCADQIATWENADYDDSDIYSLIVAGAGLSASGISDIESALASRLSDILSAAQQTNSRALVIQSLVSDVDSALSSQFTAGHPLNASDLSDIRSAVLSLSAMLSDAHSAAAQANSRALVVQSLVSDVDSALTSQYTAGYGLTASAISDVESALASRLSDILSAAQQTNSRALVIQSLVSDVDSALTSQYTAGHPLTASDLSDLRSAITAAGGGAGATASQVWTYSSRELTALGASGISDIESALASRLSDILSAAQQVNSRALVIQSMVSDVDSALTSQFTAGHPLNASDLSDIRSAITAAQSDIKSQAAAVQSDLKSAIGAVSVTLTASDISDIASAVAAAGGGATQSQVQVIVTAATSDIKSQATAIYNMLSDVQSDFQSRVPKAVATASQLTAVQSDVQSRVAAIDALLDYVAVITIGNVTGARTATEVFTYGGVTGTVSVDTSGNRTIVFS